MEILLIDDEADFLETLRISLVRQEHDVTTANDGEEGWGKIQAGEQTFDVVITDIRMSKLDGIGLLKRIRESGNSVPVLLMTGHGDLSFSIQAIKLGANDFILKPFSNQYLKSVLDKLQTDVVSKQDRRNFAARLSEESHLTFPSEHTLVPNVVSILHHHYLPNCERHDISPHLIDLCVNEAVMNAIVHGNLEVDSALKEESWESFQQKLEEREAVPEHGKRPVKVHFHQNPRQLRFEIQDEGRGFDHKKYLASLNEPNLDTVSFGRGIALIHSIMDELFWNEEGTKITFVKNFQQGE